MITAVDASEATGSPCWWRNGSNNLERPTLNIKKSGVLKSLNTQLVSPLACALQSTQGSKVESFKT